jgi:hypothetical protein
VTQTPPSLVEHRVTGAEAAVVFIHGFSGAAAATWTGFIELLLEDPQLANWDVLSIGYATSLRVDVPRIWAADPDLGMCALGLRTRFSLAPLNRYRALVLAAHSMGGLVAQRAVLDDKTLSIRLVQLFLFGTPSAGLAKATLGALMKKQLRDMAPGGPFITNLRRDWTERFGEAPGFILHVISGERDVFVPPSSSLGPFPPHSHIGIPGNHLEIVRPDGPEHVGLQIMKQALSSGGRRTTSIIDGAKLAAELGHFNVVVATLYPQAGELDDSALVALALALEETGRGRQALDVLERHHRRVRTSIDALGVLAGRLKRRWLNERRLRDFQRARSLYERGLAQAEAGSDSEQAYYHAINIAFLDLMALPEASAIRDPIKAMAQRALGHCNQTPPSAWRHATEGEAALFLEDLDGATKFYRAAIELTQSPRELDSMYSQAVRVGARVFGERGVITIEKTFGLWTEEPEPT